MPVLHSLKEKRMTHVELDESGERFLIELFNQTKGNPEAKVSMYDVGAVLEMDKNLSSRVAEVLIAWELVEVRTLSGLIGITQEGIEEARRQGGIGGANADGFRLKDTPVIDDTGCKMIEQFTVGLKSQIGTLAFDFNDMTEMLADLKTIDAQLTSSKPKTGIIRETFHSVRENLKKAKATEWVRQIDGFLRE
jgi:hypothetical protein